VGARAHSGQPAQRRALLPQADSRRARGRLGQSRRPRFSHERADRPDRWTDRAGPHRPPLGQLLEPFRCRIMAHDPYVAKEVALAMHVQLTSLERVLGQSDVVVCCTPITPRTYRMIGAPQLELLRDNSVFVNVSRGGIVDPNALIARAKQGNIRVGLDVFDPEPIPEDSEIRRLPNVFLTPHIASFSAACGPAFSASWSKSWSASSRATRRCTTSPRAYWRIAAVLHPCRHPTRTGWASRVATTTSASASISPRPSPPNPLQATSGV
jgi:hypothetical protein